MPVKTYCLGKVWAWTSVLAQGDHFGPFFFSIISWRFLWHPADTGGALLTGALPHRHCASRFASWVPTWRLSPWLLIWLLKVVKMVLCTLLLVLVLVMMLMLCLEELDDLGWRTWRLFEESPTKHKPIWVVMLKQRGGVCFSIKAFQLCVTGWRSEKSHRGTHRPTPPSAVH